MIEIIREEDYGTTKEKVLPKEIKQIGKPDIGDRIYVEDRVYRYLHPYDGQWEKSAYILLGRFENYTGRQCTFIESAIRLEEMDFDGELPQWNDNTWGYIYKKLKKDHDNMVIVGWAMDVKGYLPNLTARLEKLHQNHFGGEHQVLFLMDTLEREEAFYSSRNNRLYRRDGFYIYYGKGVATFADDSELEKSEPVTSGREGYPLSEAERGGRKQAEKSVRREQENSNVKQAEKPIGRELERPLKKQGNKDSMRQMEKNLKRQEDLELQERIYFEEIHRAEKDADLASQFRRNARRKEGSYRRNMSKRQEREWAPAFSYTLLLAAVVCVLGFAAYQNYQKMNDMQMALAKINTIAAGAEAKETKLSDEVQIEQAKGQVEKQATESRIEAEQPAGGVLPVLEEAAEGATAAAETEKSATEEPDSAAVENGAAAEGTVENGAQASGTVGNGTAAEGNAATDTSRTEAINAPQNVSVEPSNSETETDALASGNEKKAEETAALSEAQTYLSQGYYIVQKGDNMATICRKVYQTTAVMDEVCKANNIDDPNAIYAGQYLTLPN